DYGDRLFIILDGEVEIIKALNTSKEHILGTVKTGESLGEMSLLDPHGRRSATARCRTEVELLDISRERFKEIQSRYPDVAMELLRLLINRMLQTELDTIADLQVKNRQLSRALDELREAQKQLIQKARMEYELQTARKIQTGILPEKPPDIPGYQVRAFYQPAREVGGDFYEFIPFADGRMLFLVGDVSGKGVPAALGMTTTHSVIRMAAQRDDSPAEILAQSNEALFPDFRSHMYVTCFCALLDPGRGTLTFSNAGHPPPIRIRAGEAEELVARGMPLGLMPGSDYASSTVEIEPGETLAFFSDGWFESHAPGGEMLGTPRWMEMLKSALDYDDPGIDKIQADMRAFTGPEMEQEDDLTLVILHRNG
ncbi:MAG TPA: SpoIIE family protein phosphatase, partial [Anaerolineaceae bacterium]